MSRRAKRSFSIDFQRAARQRLSTAEFLLNHQYNLDAMYLAGYVVECTLKVLILEATPVANRPEAMTRISSGKRGHDFEVLGGLLKDMGRPLPLEISKRLRRSTWSINLRYETGRRRTSETRAFLKTAKATYDWVKGQLP